MRRTILPLASSALVALALTACTPKTASDAPSTPPGASATDQKSDTSIVGLMADQVSPAATYLWEAVGTEAGPKGPIEKAPKTDEDWAAARRQAQQLIDAAKLLKVPGRHTALPGEKRQNPPGPTDLSPEQADAKITQQWALFLGFVDGLQAQGEAALKAIDARNVDGLMEAGGNLDEACEACHKQFWYPDAK